ncbi:MAG: porin family protein [Bacteroidaceae bacterium]|nr:porin family protein [Bacteroidaceae bacterium]
MKKIFTLVALMCAATTIYAQDIFVGGGLGYTSEKTNESGRIKNLEFTPEIGFMFNERNSFILGLGYGYCKDGGDELHKVSLLPYYEHSIPLTDKLSFNLDLGLEFCRVCGEENLVDVWGAVGLEYMLNDHWSTSLNADVFSIGRITVDNDGPETNFCDFHLFKTECLSVGFNYYF